MSLKLDVDFRPALGAVRDQGTRPTCLAHAVSVAHEHARKSTKALSPEYLHFASRDQSSSGRSVDLVANALRAHGQPYDSDCPYLGHEPDEKWRPLGKPTVFRRKSLQTKLGFPEIADAIKVGRLPVLGLELTEDFFDPSDPWIISSGKQVRGLHAVTAVGIGKLKKAPIVLIRNSWGANWANNGHAWLDTTYLNNHLRALLVLTDEAK